MAANGYQEDDMADFAQNNTSRYKIRYSTAGFTHDLVIRYDLPASPPAAATVAAVKEWLDTASPLRFADWTRIGEFWSAQGSNFFVPLAPSAAIDAGAAAIVNADAQGPMFLSHVGVTALGNHARVLLFGITYDPIAATPTAPNDYRVLDSESTTVRDMNDALQAVPDLVGIDEQPVVWHRYVNVKAHDHFVGKVRQ
jgi:hypothetical protein